MARSEYAHITAEQWERAGQIARAFFTGREQQPQETTASEDTRTDPQETFRLPLFEAPQSTRT